VLRHTPGYRLLLLLALFLVAALVPLGASLWLAIIVCAFLVSVTPKPSGVLLLTAGVSDSRACALPPFANPNIFSPFTGASVQKL
jgi:hypothetical protein